MVATAVISLALIGCPTDTPTALSVVSVTPSNGAVSVPIDTLVTIQFSEPVTDISVHDGVYIASEDGQITSRITQSGSIVTLEPYNYSPLEQSREYEIVVDSIVTAESGTKLGVPFSSRFRTAGDLVDPPYVAGHTPTADQRGVYEYTNIQIAFSKPMDRFATGVLELSNGGTPVSGDGSWNSDATEFTFSPDSNLEFDTQYLIHVTDSAVDQAGTPMDASYFAVFTTRTGIPSARYMGSVGNEARIYFDQRMDEASLSSAFSTTGTSTPPTYDLVYDHSVGSTTLQIQFSGPFIPGTYSFNVETTAESQAGFSLPSTFVYSFEIQ